MTRLIRVDKYTDDKKNPISPLKATTRYISIFNESGGIDHVTEYSKNGFNLKGIEVSRIYYEGDKMPPLMEQATEEFKEEEHPRDTGGQFTLGSTTDKQIKTKKSDTLDTYLIPKPEDRPSGKNYRIESKKAMLEGRIKSEVTFIEKIKAKGELPQERIKELEEEIDKVRKQILTLEEEDKKLGLPNIPMGKNTHTKNRDGYVFNKTRINVQLNVKNDLVTNMLQARVQGMWNSLPDDVRDMVRTFNVKQSRSTGRTWRGGSYNHELKAVHINISVRATNAIAHDFFHEIGHLKWDNLKDKNPEKIQKFIEKQKEIGVSPTAYSGAYIIIKQKNDEKERKYRRAMGSREIPISPKGELILEQNRKTSEDLYQNEIHSELNAYAMGSLPTKLITASKEEMTELLNAYKELWDLE